MEDNLLWETTIDGAKPSNTTFDGMATFDKSCPLMGDIL